MLLAAVVAGGTVDQAEPRAVGHWLVDNHFIDPVSLDHTLTVLGEHLPTTPERLAPTP